mmetsp:Transcript_7611/g.14080  ORF Transcript_7611/g.14080 Transcript_7611/m.14080 type:complete len:204 (+) Transcript_7611:3083-3694(+)
MLMLRQITSPSWSSLSVDRTCQTFRTSEIVASAKASTTQPRSCLSASTTIPNLPCVTSISKSTEKLLPLRKRRTMFRRGNMFASPVYVRKNSGSLLLAVLKSSSILITWTRLYRTIPTWGISPKLFLCSNKESVSRTPTLEFSRNLVSCIPSMYQKRPWSIARSSSQSSMYPRSCEPANVPDFGTLLSTCTHTTSSMTALLRS